MGEGWRLLVSPLEYKSILGLIPKYKYINRLMYNNRISNPVLKAGIY